eukprot:g7921.t1
MSRSGSRSRSPAPERRRRDRSDSGGRRSPAAAKARSPRRDDKAKAPIGKGAFGGYRGFDENEMSKTLFVANISDDADERDVQEMFVSFGFEVSEVSLPRSGGERGHRGYGFVHLVKGRDVDDAISKCHGHELKGRPLNAVRPVEAREAVVAEEIPAVAVETTTEVVAVTAVDGEDAGTAGSAAAAVVAVMTAAAAANSRMASKVNVDPPRRLEILALILNSIGT